VPVGGSEALEIVDTNARTLEGFVVFLLPLKSRTQNFRGRIFHMLFERIFKTRDTYFFLIGPARARLRGRVGGGGPSGRAVGEGRRGKGQAELAAAAPLGD